ncbi:MAG TPA: hypothetical protein DDZ66_07025 [Firmicutes bacterium]|jgi:hypothetical protein|nr:hypothetical protein [Bacillota bacterium]
MVRKSLLIVLGLVVVLSFSSIAFAQEYWAWNKFTAEHERFKYEITSYSTHWDYDAEEDVFIETHQVQVMELRRRDDETTEVTMAYTYDVPTAELGDALSLMGIGMGWATGGGEWMGEFMILGLFGADLELEVGSSMQLFDGSKIRVVEKQTVAGVEGYLCTKSVRSEDEAGNRVDVLTSEWVIAPNVGWPLSVRVYDEGDQVKYVMELVEYARN